MMSIFTRKRRSAGPPAKPGPWFGKYHADWDRDHPGMWMKGEAQSGSFYAGDAWASSTLDWDRDWFEAQGMSMPRNCVYRLDPIGHGELRIGSLGPGESVAFQVDCSQPEDGDSR